MKKAGVYYSIPTGVIWLCEKVEHYEKSIVQDGQEFSLIISGCVDGRFKIHRCLIRKDQFKFFKYLGPL